MGDAAQGTRRIELVASSSPDNTEAGRTGLGLMVGLFVGRHSLMGAATGSERFEVAIAHFVGLVLVSVAGALILGVLYDQAKRTAERADQAANESATDVEVDVPDFPMGSVS